MKWTPDIVIAILVVVICGILMGLHINGEVKGVFSLAAGWAFGRGYQTVKAK
jgi:hypothetical protein